MHKQRHSRIKQQLIAGHRLVSCIQLCYVANEDQLLIDSATSLLTISLPMLSNIAMSLYDITHNEAPYNKKHVYCLHEYASGRCWMVSRHCVLSLTTLPAIQTVQ